MTSLAVPLAVFTLSWLAGLSYGRGWVPVGVVLDGFAMLLFVVAGYPIWRATHVGAQLLRLRVRLGGWTRSTLGDLAARLAVNSVVAGAFSFAALAGDGRATAHGMNFLAGAYGLLLVVPVGAFLYTMVPVLLQGRDTTAAGDQRTDPPPATRDLYEDLKVSPNAPPEVIQAAYQRLARSHHPDAGGDAAVMVRLNQAFETLSDPERRARYDAALAARTGGAFPQHPDPDTSTTGFAAVMRWVLMVPAALLAATIVAVPVGLWAHGLAAIVTSAEGTPWVQSDQLQRVFIAFSTPAVIIYVASRAAPTGRMYVARALAVLSLLLIGAAAALGLSVAAQQGTVSTSGYWILAWLSMGTAGTVFGTYRAHAAHQLAQPLTFRALWGFTWRVFVFSAPITWPYLGYRALRALRRRYSAA